MTGKEGIETAKRGTPKTAAGYSGKATNHSKKKEKLRGFTLGRKNTP